VTPSVLLDGCFFVTGTQDRKVGGNRPPGRTHTHIHIYRCEVCLWDFGGECSARDD